MIPLLDLKELNASMQEEIEEALLRVARSGRYVLGPEVEAFEAEWAAYCGVKHCVGTANALESLELILRGLGIGYGDDVLVPSNTYIATWLAVTHTGAHPVPVEPALGTHNIDPDRIEAAITPRTRAIMVVHLYGRPCEMHAINLIAQRRGLAVIEDAAQAHGASYYSRRAGALGDAAGFSFYPSKNLGSLGDAGCVTTNDASLAARVRRMRNYGGVGRIDHTVMGINSRLDEMQAAVLRAKLPFLQQMNDARAARATTYRFELAQSVRVPSSQGGGVWHQFVIRHPHRDRLQMELAQMGVDTHVHYPVPPHLEGAYAHFNFMRGSFPIAERMAAEVLSLPIGNDVDVYLIAHRVRQAIEQMEVRV